MPPWGVYIPKFSKMLAKFLVLGVLYPYRCTDGVKFGTAKWTFGPLIRAKCHPHWCNVSPLRGEKPQNRPLSRLTSTPALALRPMLPVITHDVEMA